MGTERGELSGGMNSEDSEIANTQRQTKPNTRNSELIPKPGLCFCVNVCLCCDVQRGIMGKQGTQRQARMSGRVPGNILMSRCGMSNQV